MNDLFGWKPPFHPSLPTAIGKPITRHTGALSKSISSYQFSCDSHPNLTAIPTLRVPTPSFKWCGGWGVGEATWPVARSAGLGAGGAPSGALQHQIRRGCLNGALPPAKRSEFRAAAPRLSTAAQSAASRPPAQKPPPRPARHTTSAHHPAPRNWWAHTPSVASHPIAPASSSVHHPAFSIPRFSMNAITSANPVLVFRLVITNGFSPWALVRMRMVSASITARSAPT